VILPDSPILLDYPQHLAIRVVRGMVVHADRMRENLDLTYGALFSQRVLLALVTGGMTRDEAYRVVQELAQRAWDERIRYASCSRSATSWAWPSTRCSICGTTPAMRQEIVGRLANR
jgi:adenylosuccinate lyase